MLSYRERQKIKEQIAFNVSVEKAEKPARGSALLTALRITKYGFFSIVVPTTVASLFSVFATTYTSCEEHLVEDSQKFERILIELDNRVNSVAINLAGANLTNFGKPQTSEADMKIYETAYSDAAPSLLSEFKGRSFNDLQVELYQIASRWYRVPFSDDTFGMTLHPVRKNIELARFMFAAVLAYNRNKEQRVLDQAIEKAKAVLAAPQGWRSSDGTAHSIHTLGATCPRWRSGVEAIKFLMRGPER